MARTYICPACGSRSISPIKKHDSSLAAEIAVWIGCALVGLLTGFWLVMVFALIFSLWRQFSKKGSICPSCKQDGMIPMDSPRGKELSEKYAAK